MYDREEICIKRTFIFIQLSTPFASLLERLCADFYRSVDWLRISYYWQQRLEIFPTPTSAQPSQPFNSHETSFFVCSTSIKWTLFSSSVPTLHDPT